jgi:hypothetical protein
MPRGVYERTPKEDKMPSNEAPQVAAVSIEKQPEKLFPVLLTKNYAVSTDKDGAPTFKFEIVGYLKDAVKRKNAAGTWKIVEPEEFIKGEMKPHSSPGVGFANKIWAGTTLKLPVAEAKRLIGLKAAERADDLAA